MTIIPESIELTIEFPSGLLILGNNVVRFRFKTKKIQDLYTTGKGSKKYPESIIDAFFELMSVIDAARDERDFYALKSLHYEKLKGKRKNQRSLRLNVQYRLVIQVNEDQQGKYLEVLDIEDYH